jgi:hypothetical protein
MSRLTKAEVKEFYDFECQLCFEKFHPTWLQIHHIKPKREISDENFENRIPLCGGINTPWCHGKVEREFIYKNIKGRVIYDCEETRLRNNLELLFPRIEDRVLTLAA